MRMLGLDIETAPGVAYYWNRFDKNPISTSMVQSTPYVLCFAAKWFGERGTQFFSIREGRDVMLQAAHDLLDEADVVVHYNGTSFDIPWLQSEMTLIGLTPPSSFKQIDLWRVVSKKFHFDSNKLADVAPALGVGSKTKTSGFSIWPGCMAGDEKSWREMEKYNRKDAALMEPLYHRLLPWIPNHPNRNLFQDAQGCTKCGSGRLQRHGTVATNASTFQRWKCQDCGSTCRSSKRIDHTTFLPIAGS